MSTLVKSSTVNLISGHQSHDNFWLHFILECECYNVQSEHMCQNLDFNFGENDDNGKSSFIPVISETFSHFG